MPVVCGTLSLVPVLRSESSAATSENAPIWENFSAGIKDVLLAVWKAAAITRLRILSQDDPTQAGRGMQRDKVNLPTCFLAQGGLQVPSEFVLWP